VSDLDPHELKPDDQDWVSGIAPPMLYTHCCNLYQAMYEHANTSEREGVIYTGSLTTLVEAVGIASAHYTPVTRKLKSMGCMRQLERGGGGKPSMWLLIHAPTPESYRSTPFNSDGSGPKSANDQLAQMVRDLDRRMTAIETHLRSHGAPI
jgi:hypothetical protein